MKPGIQFTDEVAEEEPVQAEITDEMRILFLDIDGVVNSKESWTILGPSFPRQDEFPKDLNFDPISIGLICRACIECGLKVYVHSTWARGLSQDYFQAMLNFAAQKTQVKKAPEVLSHIQRFSEQARISRIHSGLCEYKPKRYVVIDDDRTLEDDWNHLKKFPDGKLILTNGDSGFRWEHYVKVLEHFGKKQPLILL